MRPTRARLLGTLALFFVLGWTPISLWGVDKSFFRWPERWKKSPVPRAQSEDSQRFLEILVELAWMADPVTFPYFLEARADKKTLEVRGYVPSPAVRRHAMQIAKLHSPMQVVDALREHPSLAVKIAPLAPPQLHASVQGALRAAFPKQFPFLGVKCGADGKVTVLGAVRSFEEKLAVSQALRRLHGCTSVANLLEAIPEGPLPILAEPKEIAPAKPGPTAAPRPTLGPVLPVLEVSTRKKEPGDEPSKNAQPGPVSVDAALTKLAAQFNKRIQAACPTATDVRVQITAGKNARIEVGARSDEELRAFADRIFALPELQAYRVDLHVTVQNP